MLRSEDAKTASVTPLSALPLLFNLIRKQFPILFGPDVEDFDAELNLYYELASGIGFHGDGERKSVIALSLGRETRLVYQWLAPLVRGASHDTSLRREIVVKAGSLYVMSEKATGHDWKRSRNGRKEGNWRLVHAAGGPKYTAPKKRKEKRKRDCEVADVAVIEGQATTKKQRM